MANFGPVDRLIILSESYPPDGTDYDTPTTGFPARSFTGVTIHIIGSTEANADRGGGTSSIGTAAIQYTTNGGGLWTTYAPTSSVASDFGGGADNATANGPWDIVIGDVADISQLGIRGRTSGTNVGGAGAASDGTVTVTNWYLIYDYRGGIIGA